MRALGSSDRSLRSHSRSKSCSLPLPMTCLLTGLAFALTGSPAKAGPYTDPGHPPLAMAAWASEVDEVVRGPVDIANPAGGLASFGAPANVVGVATGNSLDILSLGDGGSITLYFDAGIHNGPGDDLAVFENGFLFGDGSASRELAFVEVGSDGFAYARFAATALNAFPLDSFDPLDPTDYHGLAGRHEIGLGTGFDLAGLACRSARALGRGRPDRTCVMCGSSTSSATDPGSTVRGGRSTTPTPRPSPRADSISRRSVRCTLPSRPSRAGCSPARAACSSARRAAAGARARPPTSRVRSPARSSRCWPRSQSLWWRRRRAEPSRRPSMTWASAPNAYLNGSTLSGGYTSGGIFFENDYNASFDVFQGFAASTTTDTTTAGYGNQFSNVTGGGAGGSSGFGLAFLGGRIVLPETQIVLGAQFTNTTYAALSMRDGDAFSKQFGGPTGIDSDFFRLLVEGIDAGGTSTGTVELMLADFRSADHALDSILDEWVFLDLSGLGAVRELRFGFESSDVGPFGINTPTYFAIDDLVTIPEPGASLLIGLGLAILGLRPRDLR